MKYLFAALATASLVSTAAAEETVMVAPLDGSVAAHPDLARELSGALIAAAQQASVGHVKGAIGLDELGLMSGCSIEDRGCRETLLSTLGTDSIIGGSVSDAGGAVQVTVVRIGSDASMTTERHELAGRTRAELLASFEPIAARVFGEPEPKPETDPEPKAEVEPEPAPAEPTPAADVPAPAIASAPPADGSRFGGIEPWTLGVIGGGALITAGGLVTLVLAGNVQSDIDQAPTSTTADLEALEELESSGRFRYRLSYGLLAAGGATLAAGITLAILQHRRHARGSHVAVVRSGGGYAAVFGGRF